MSYSIMSDCSKCEHVEKCIDLSILQGAVSTIHGVNTWSFKSNQVINRGHLGSGTIHLECQNFKQEVKDN